jgi:glycosyltransferase involved in cell wall biosynthesis
MASVTAIVSAYFSAEFLEGRIKNLLAQMPRPEVIVVCQEGSEDARLARDRRDVTVIHTANVPTIYAAWNLAVQAAQGDYLTNANSDDRHYPGALATLSRALDEHPDVALVYADDDIVREVGGDPVNRHQWIEGDFDVLRQVCFLGPMPMWRKSLHDKYGLFDESMKVAGDYEFWLRVASRGETFLHLPRAIGAYAMRSDSAERRESLRTIWETARARSRYEVSA